MTDPEIVANHIEHEARAAYQAALDRMMAGDPVLLAALMERYRPITEFMKEGPDVGFREEAESVAGRVN
ncbi:MAG: hypothetical protein K0S99_1803 [Thermomicrobiales bacterium]|jgi:hypothetical protein|nr:hypothetical protein [Thermomicrobiales bacterium]